MKKLRYNLCILGPASVDEEVHMEAADAVIYIHCLPKFFLLTHKPFPPCCHGPLRHHLLNPLFVNCDMCPASISPETDASRSPHLLISHFSMSFSGIMSLIVIAEHESRELNTMSALPELEQPLCHRAATYMSFKPYRSRTTARWWADAAMPLEQRS